MIQLISDDTYELPYPLGDNKKPEEQTVFVLRRMSAKHWNSIQNRLMVSTGEGDRTGFAYLLGESNRLSVQYCLVNWRNVRDAKSNDVPCTDANKEQLPSAVQTFLAGHIADVNNLRSPEEYKKK